MNQALHGLLTRYVIDRGSEIGEILFGPDGKGLGLFFDGCGLDPKSPLVDGCDAKHVLKRFRMALKRVGGVQIKVCSFGKKLLTRLLIEIGIPSKKVKTMWGEGEEDAQNVPAATCLMLALSTFQATTPLDFSAERRASPI